MLAEMPTLWLLPSDVQGALLTRAEIIQPQVLRVILASWDTDFCSRSSFNVSWGFTEEDPIEEPSSAYTNTVQSERWGLGLPEPLE